MPTIEAKYEVTLSDYRKATYYALFLRHRKPLALMFLALGLALAYTLLGLIGSFRIQPIIPALAGAYLVWGLILFAGAEQGIRKYLRTPNCLIGCKYQMTIDAKSIRVQVPERRIDTRFEIKHLACAFEISAMFLIYVDALEVYPLPVRALEADERAQLRAYLKTVLKDRFSTRFS